LIINYFVFFLHKEVNLGKHLGEIGAPMSCDIGQPQCHKCTKRQNPCKWERRKPGFFCLFCTLM